MHKNAIASLIAAELDLSFRPPSILSIDVDPDALHLVTNSDDSNCERNSNNSGNHGISGAAANQDLDADSEGQDSAPGTSAPAVEPPPSIKVAMKALGAIWRILKPPRDSGLSYKATEVDKMLEKRLDEMTQLLWAYVNPLLDTHVKWMASSLSTAKALKKAPWHTRMLWGHCQAFISNPNDLSYSPPAT